MVGGWRDDDETNTKMRSGKGFVDRRPTYLNLPSRRVAQRTTIIPERQDKVNGMVEMVNKNNG